MNIRKFKDDINICSGCKSSNIRQVGNIRCFDQSIHVIECQECRLISQYSRLYDLIPPISEPKKTIIQKLKDIF